MSTCRFTFHSNRGWSSMNEETRSSFNLKQFWNPFDFPYVFTLEICAREHKKKVLVKKKVYASESESNSYLNSVISLETSLNVRIRLGLHLPITTLLQVERILVLFEFLIEILNFKKSFLSKKKFDFFLQ